MCLDNPYLPPIGRLLEALRRRAQIGDSTTIQAGHRSLAEEIGVSASYVPTLMRKLEADGHIRRHAWKNGYLVEVIDHGSLIDQSCVIDHTCDRSPDGVLMPQTETIPKQVKTTCKEEHESIQEERREVPQPVAEHNQSDPAWTAVGVDHPAAQSALMAARPDLSPAQFAAAVARALQLPGITSPIGFTYSRLLRGLSIPAPHTQKDEAPHVSTRRQPAPRAAEQPAPTPSSSLPPGWRIRGATGGRGQLDPAGQ